MGVKTAGVIGTRWGRTLVGALRAAGVDVRALCGRDPEKTRAIASEEGVPVATTRPEDLRGLDLVAIAAPPAAHAELMARFPNERILVEKPVLGIHSPSAPLPAPERPVFVNYAFPFLEVARSAARQLGDLGPLRWARVGAEVSLEDAHLEPPAGGHAELELERWFFEVASHPLSFALHLAGPLDPRRRRVHPERLELELEAERGAEVEARVALGGPPGIRYEVELAADGGRVSFSGALVLGGEPWRFGPVYRDGRALPQPEDELDPWVAANHAGVARLLDHLASGEPRASGLADGLFDLERGLLVERALGRPVA